MAAVALTVSSAVAAAPGSSDPAAEIAALRAQIESGDRSRRLAAFIKLLERHRSAPMADGAQLAERAIALLPDDGDPTYGVDVLNLASYALVVGGQPERGLALADRALDDLRGEGPWTRPAWPT
ncbi:MAG: hypothetical protein AAFU65_05465 [Pseudomonadota bacterium]